MTTGHCRHGEFALEKGCPQCVAERQAQLQEDERYRDMYKLSAGHLCGKCGGFMGVAWDTKANEYVLRCGNNPTHNTVTRHDLEYEKQLAEVRRVQKLDSKALMVMSEDKMLERVAMAKFPQDLTPTEKRLLAQVAITYGFDPIMGEVTIYQGRPWVSIDGRYRSTGYRWKYLTKEALATN